MLKNLRPDYYYETIYHIPFSFYKEHHITTIFADLDNTLTGDEDRTQPEHFLHWYEALKKEGIELVIVSNNRKSTRVEEFVGDLGIEWYHLAYKQTGKLFRKLMATRQISAEVVAVIGDRITTDIYGGKKVGALAILTKPMTPDHDIWIKVMRGIEAMFIPKMTEGTDIWKK